MTAKHPPSDGATGAAPTASLAIPASAPALVIREATPDDYDFILEQILDCARHGHFDRRVLLPPQHKTLLEEIRSIIRHKRLATEPLNAQAIVFMRGSERVGHAIVTEAQGSVGAELYAMALDRRWRGTGTGAAMLDLLIAHYLARMGVIYARCFPRSVIMYELLVSRGFEYVLTTRAGTRLLRLTDPKANIPPLP